MEQIQNKKDELSGLNFALAGKGASQFGHDSSSAAGSPELAEAQASVIALENENRRLQQYINNIPVRPITIEGLLANDPVRLEHNEKVQNYQKDIARLQSGRNEVQFKLDEALHATAQGEVEINSLKGVITIMTDNANIGNDALARLATSEDQLKTRNIWLDSQFRALSNRNQELEERLNSQQRPTKDATLVKGGSSAEIEESLRAALQKIESFEAETQHYKTEVQNVHEEAVALRERLTLSTNKIATLEKHLVEIQDKSTMPLEMNQEVTDKASVDSEQHNRHIDESQYVQQTGQASTQVARSIPACNEPELLSEVDEQAKLAKLPGSFDDDDQCLGISSFPLTTSDTAINNTATEIQGLSASFKTAASNLKHRFTSVAAAMWHDSKKTIYYTIAALFLFVLFLNYHAWTEPVSSQDVYMPEVHETETSSWIPFCSSAAIILASFGWFKMKEWKHCSEEAKCARLRIEEQQVLRRRALAEEAAQKKAKEEAYEQSRFARCYRSKPGPLTPCRSGIFNTPYRAHPHLRR